MPVMSLLRSEAGSIAQNLLSPRLNYPGSLRRTVPLTTLSSQSFTVLRAGSSQVQHRQAMNHLQPMASFLLISVSSRTTSSLLKGLRMAGRHSWWPKRTSLCRRVRNRSSYSLGLCCLRSGRTDCRAGRYSLKNWGFWVRVISRGRNLGATTQLTSSSRVISSRIRSLRNSWIQATSNSEGIYSSLLSRCPQSAALKAGWDVLNLMFLKRSVMVYQWLSMFSIFRQRMLQTGSSYLLDLRQSLVQREGLIVQIARTATAPIYSLSGGYSGKLFSLIYTPSCSISIQSGQNYCSLRKAISSWLSSNIKFLSTAGLSSLFSFSFISTDQPFGSVCVLRICRLETAPIRSMQLLGQICLHSRYCNMRSEASRESAMAWATLIMLSPNRLYSSLHFSGLGHSLTSPSNRSICSMGQNFLRLEKMDCSKLVILLETAFLPSNAPIRMEASTSPQSSFPEFRVLGMNPALQLGSFSWAGWWLRMNGWQNGSFVSILFFLDPLP